MSHTNPFRRLTRRHRAPITRGRPAALVAALGVVFVLDACNLESSLPSTPTLTPAAIALVSGGAQVGAAGNTLPLPAIIRVTDASGLSVGGAQVSFTPAASSGSVNWSTIFTDTSGSVAVLWTLGTAPGADSLSVSVAGVSTFTVTATATAGSPASIAIVSGGAQTAAAGTTLATPLTVKVTDRFGNAVANANVSWSTNVNGAFPSASAATDADGIASATYTLGTTPGPQRVTVTVSTAVGAMLTTITATGT